MPLLIAEILLVGLVIVGLYEARRRLSLALLFIFVAANQYVQNLQLSSLTVELFSGLTTSPGSAVLFSSSIFAVLLIYIKEDVPTTRRLIYGVVFANASLAALTVTTRLGIETGQFTALSSYHEILTSFEVGAFLVGTALLIADSVLIIVVYETLFSRARWLPALGRMIASLAIVLGFDGVVFVSMNFAGEVGYADILAGNLIGKAVSGTLYGTILWGYLRLRGDATTELSRDPPTEIRDVFSILRYRERYASLKAEKEDQERLYLAERQRTARALDRTQDQLRQSQKMEALGRLAGGIAHDFNNILTAILSWSDLLLEELDENNPRREEAEEIKNAGERGAALTRQLLALSRNQVLSPRILDLNESARNLSGMIQRLSNERLQIVTNLAPDLGHIRADPSQIEQVILNLVVNARDAMPDGGEMQITTANRHLPHSFTPEGNEVAAGDYAMIEVTDTGVGMDSLTLQRIFEPFYTTKDQAHGTGLGLSIVYGIVEQSGGHVEVESKPTMGTVFRVFFPHTEEREPAK